MAYFDDKEDVLGIELTPLGRTLLSKGLLKPAYYAFLDDDVLYDIESSGDTESNYQIKARILNETPRVRPQTNLKDLDKKNKDLHPDLTNDVVKYNLYPLGTSNNKESETPSWKVKVLNNELVSTKYYLSSSYGIHDIPQLNIDIEYSLSIENTNNLPNQTGLAVSPNLQISSVYSDGTFLKIEEEQAILQILERNGFLHGESMQVEAFLFDDAEEEKLIPLKFIKNNREIENDLLLDDDQKFQDLVEPDPKTVEYYFDVRVDKEIPTSDYGKTGTGNSEFTGLNGAAGDESDFDSSLRAGGFNNRQIQTRSFQSPNIYRSPVTDSEIEDCD